MNNEMLLWLALIITVFSMLIKRKIFLDLCEIAINTVVGHMLVAKETIKSNYESQINTNHMIAQMKCMLNKKEDEYQIELSKYRKLVALEKPKIVRKDLRAALYAEVLTGIKDGISDKKYCVTNQELTDILDCV